MKQKVILLGLNELNFDFIQKYVAKGHLPNFKGLIAKFGYHETTSEAKYELLEPWIQWVSVHTGKTFDEHRVFRLGDIVERPDLKQLWEIAEEKGLTVGAISPFNASNNAKNPLFFVPDPWTQTPAKGPNTLVQLSGAISSAVNNNASNSLGKGSAVAILKGILAYLPLKRYPSYAKLATRLKQKATKSIILDNLLADVFLTMWQKKQPDFSSLFLNSGAHLQHHYMFNSRAYDGNLKNPEWYIPAAEDPLLDVLEAYDTVLGRLLALNCRLFIATGLHQTPHVKNTYYWRLKDHESFLQLLGIANYTKVVPRMSRDFLIEFASEADASAAVESLGQVAGAIDGEAIFTADNRGKSIFVELTYDKDVTNGFALQHKGQILALDFYRYVAFVAIKNGEHNGVGYFIDTKKTASQHKPDMPITAVFDEIVASF